MNRWIKDGGVHAKTVKSKLKGSASTLKRPAAAGDNADVGGDDADVGNVDPGKSKKFKKLQVPLQHVCIAPVCIFLKS